MYEPKIRYYLESKNMDDLMQKEKAVIMAEVSYRYAELTKSGKRRNKPFRISLGKSIEPSKFGKEENGFKFDATVFKKSQSNNSSVKREMQKLEDNVAILYNNYDLKQIIPKPEEFKNDLEVLLKRKNELIKPQLSLLDYCYLVIKTDENNLERGISGANRDNTIKTYRTVSRHLENYQLATNETLKFDNFDLATYWKYWDVLDDILKGEIKVDNPNQPKKQPTKKHGYLKKSLRKYQISFLKVFKRAIEEGYKTTFNPNQKNLLVGSEESKKEIFIKEEELQKIIDSNVEHDYSLQNAKEFIIIASLTGSRFESLYDFHKEEIKLFKEGKYDFSYIHSHHNKTNTEVIIPLLKPVLEIVKSNGGKFPKFYSNSKINKNLKLLFEHIGLERKITETLRTYRSGVVTENKFLYQLISTHDGKKTFTSNLAFHRVPESVISKITHPDRPTKNKMFAVYNNLDRIDNAKMFVDEINKIDSNIYKF